MMIAPGDGGKHEYISSVFRTEDGSALLIVVGNEDTGISESRTIVVATR